MLSTYVVETGQPLAAFTEAGRSYDDPGKQTGRAGGRAACRA
jgi:hypothetical protein